MTAKKCTKKRDARAELLFCLIMDGFFDVLVSVAVVAAKAPGGSLFTDPLFSLQSPSSASHEK